MDRNPAYQPSGTSKPQAAPQIDGISKRATIAIESAKGIEARLRNILDRLRGSTPMPVDEKAGACAGGAIHNIKLSLDLLEGTLASSHNALEELEGLV